MILSSIFDVELLKYESSPANALPFPGDKGVPASRPNFVGLPRVEELSFMAFSKAVGRSLAPGGFCFLLGLPCGVATGVMKLLRVGVLGRSLNWSLEGAGRGVSLFPPCEEGKRLLRKLDIAAD
jgi:hypothetical protein